MNRRGFLKSLAAAALGAAVPIPSLLPKSRVTFSTVKLTARNLVMYTLACNELLQDNVATLDVLMTRCFEEHVMRVTWLRERAMMEVLDR